MAINALKRYDAIKSVKINGYDVIKYEILENEIIFNLENSEGEVFNIFAIIKHLKESEKNPKKIILVQEGIFVKKGKSLYEKMPELKIEIELF